MNKDSFWIACTVLFILCLMVYVAWTINHDRAEKKATFMNICSSKMDRVECEALWGLAR